jgi:hypothetical protein
LRKQKARVLAKLRKATAPELAKAGDDDEPDISDETVDQWLGNVVPEDEQGHIADTMADVYAESGRSMFAQVGNTDREDFFHKIHERAVTWSEDNVGELISGIDETTRDAIRTEITDGLAAGKTRDEIAAGLEENWAFDEKRALLIANTEIADANSQGGLAGAKAARDDLGIESYKEWLLGPNPCEICEGNNDDGPIPLDDDFSSGDDAPTAHPYCECALTYVAAPAGDEDEGE